MALPTVTTVKNSVTLPSGVKVSIRPFVGTEEKAILAVRNSDRKTIFNTVLEVLSSCSNTDCSKLDMTDMEYLYLKVYEIAVSANIEVGLVCKSCGEVHEVKIPTNLIKVPKSGEKQTKIPVGKVEGTDEDVTIVLNRPILGDFVDSLSVDGGDSDMKLIWKSLEGIYVGSEAVETTEEEFGPWLLGLVGAYSKCQKFLTSAPQIELKRDWKCQKCKADNQTHLKGFKDFFSH